MMANNKVVSGVLGESKTFQRAARRLGSPVHRHINLMPLDRDIDSPFPIYWYPAGGVSVTRSTVSVIVPVPPSLLADLNCPARLTITFLLFSAIYMSNRKAPWPLESDRLRIGCGFAGVTGARICPLRRRKDKGSLVLAITRKCGFLNWRRGGVRGLPMGSLGGKPWRSQRFVCR